MSGLLVGSQPSLARAEHGLRVFTLASEDGHSLSTVTASSSAVFFVTQEKIRCQFSHVNAC